MFNNISIFSEFNEKADADKVPEELLVQFVQLATPDAKPATEEQLTALNLLNFWPDDLFFPVLDIIRSAVVREPVAQQILTDDLVEKMLNYLADSGRMATQLMACRCFVNLFKHEGGRRRLQTFLNLVMLKFPTTETTNANLQIALSTLLLNLSIRNFEGLAPELLASRLVSVFMWVTDLEAAFRILLGVGNLLALGESGPRKYFADSRQFVERVQKFCNDVVPDQHNKVTQVAKEVQKFLA